MSSKEQCSPAARRVKDVKVKVVTTGDPASPYEVKWQRFWPFWTSAPIGTEEGANVDLKFELQDKAKTGVSFKKTAKTAFGAHADTGSCPPAGSDGGGEIDFANSSVSGSTMTIRDCNVRAGDLNFALYFSDGSKHDPIIKNTGGGTPP